MKNSENSVVVILSALIAGIVIGGTLAPGRDRGERHESEKPSVKAARRLLALIGAGRARYEEIRSAFYQQRALRVPDRARTKNKRG